MSAVPYADFPEPASGFGILAHERGRHRPPPLARIPPMAALLLSLALCAQEFDYRQGVGVVDLSTNESRSPEDFLKWALAQRDAGKLIVTVKALNLLATRIPDAAIRETAHFERAAT